MLTKLMAGTLGGAVLVAAYVVHQGAVRVAVDEQVPGGTHLHLLLPAALVPAGLYFVPERKLREVMAQARPWLPAIRAASEQLAPLPDCDLVEVRDTREHVRISKRGALLVLDVESARETVHVSLPLRTMEKVARRLESLGPAS